MTKVLKQAAPNGWYVALEEDGGCYFVIEGDDDVVEFDIDRDAALNFYDTVVERLRATPNWEAQARYDEAHGTDNGYGLWQSAREY